MTAHKEHAPYRLPVDGADVPDNADAFRSALRLGSRYRIRAADDGWIVHPQTQLNSQPMSTGKQYPMTYYTPGQEQHVDSELGYQFIEAAVHVAADKYEREDPEGRDGEGLSRGLVLRWGGIDIDADAWGRFMSWKLTGAGYEAPTV